MSIIFPATVSTTATEVAPAEDAPLKPIQEEIVEESETALESPSGAQDVVEDVNSPSPSASLRYSNIFSFPADDVVDKFLQGANTGIGFYFLLSSRNLLPSNIFTNQISFTFVSFFSSC